MNEYQQKVCAVALIRLSFFVINANGNSSFLDECEL